MPAPCLVPFPEPEPLQSPERERLGAGTRVPGSAVPEARAAHPQRDNSETERKLMQRRSGKQSQQSESPSAGIEGGL
ncbi:hypothetical protein chiPu_0016621 [Chiloscyllium punctatum]|uniref:Uncharacterized protein n=1 Tax=Chiloscyllium punctatum TaxID=137246 RepID=A0A401T658_CHIPU|nr:hypothetical protein [Chiloscyllium punctatum]